MKIEKLNINEIEENLFFKKSNLKKHFKYFKVAKELFEKEFYEDLSTQAIILYALFRDRMELSAKNGWFDRNGRVYINYSNNSVIKYFNGKRGFKTKKRVIELKKELEDKKLIFQMKQLGNSNRIYVLKTLSDDELKGGVKNNTRGVSKTTLGGVSKTTLGGCQKRHPNETNKSETKYNKTEFSERINSVADEKIKNFNKCVAEIEKIIGNDLSKIDIERLQNQVTNTGQSLSLVLHAYKMCVERNNPKNSSYVTAILKNWYTDHRIKTVEDLKRVEEKKKQDKKKREFKRTGKYIEEKDILTEEEKEERLKKSRSSALEMLEKYSQEVVV